MSTGAAHTTAREDPSPNLTLSYSHALAGYEVTDMPYISTNGTASPPPLAMPPAGVGTEAGDFAELTRTIREQGLLEKQLGYYTFKILSTLAMLSLSISLLIVVENFWFQLFNAAFLAFVFGQIGYVGHDAGHLGVCRSIRGNRIIGYGVNFLISLSQSWWITQHNQHHRTPNDLDDDPHTLIPLLAFSVENARRKRGMLRFLVGYQAFYFVPLLLLEGVGIRLASFQFLVGTRKARLWGPEIGLMALHFILYFGLLFYALSPGEALAFAAVHQGLFGLYYGLIFAPNHKGMLILDKNNPLDFVRTQVLTTRNVRPSVLVDLMYGGLNYQIEHHLFTMMPRKSGEGAPHHQEFLPGAGHSLPRDRGSVVLPGNSQLHARGGGHSQSRVGADSEG
jgi:fatty acid desaturase